MSKFAIDLLEHRIRNGCLLSIVNLQGTDFTAFTPRPGAQKDGENLKKVFIDSFGMQYLFTFDLRDSATNEFPFFTNFKISDFNHNLNDKRKYMFDDVENCSCLCCRLKNVKLTGKDCLVLTISSHGCEIDGETMIQCVDGLLLPVSEVYKAVNIPALREIPKILIIQACRARPGGKKEANDEGVDTLEEDGGESVLGPTVIQDTVPNASRISPEEEAELDKIRCAANVRRTGMRRLTELPPNIFAVFPTWKGNFSFRFADGGSWLEDALLQVSKDLQTKQQQHINLFDLFTDVTNLVSKQESYCDPRFDEHEAGMKNTVAVVHNFDEVISFQLKH